MNSSGMPCIEPSFLTRLSLYAGEGAAKFLYWKNGKTQSVGWGVGGSAGVGAYGGGTASGSWLDTVDINGNAAQVTTAQVGPAAPAFGAAGVFGLQVQASRDPVPQTPQFSLGRRLDPTISVGGGSELGVNVDLAKSGTTTITVGAGEGIKGISTSLLPVYGIAGSIPYCRW